LENVQKMLSSGRVAATLSISISEEEFTVQVLSRLFNVYVRASAAAEWECVD